MTAAVQVVQGISFPGEAERGMPVTVTRITTRRSQLDLEWSLFSGSGGSESLALARMVTVSQGTRRAGQGRVRRN